jgi:phosphonopyruvate decarboxylase
MRAPRNVSRLETRSEALRRIAAALRPDDVVVATTGMTSRELFHVADRNATFYMMGSMGCAPAIALGISRCRPGRKVVVIDGDGAFLMRMGTAATIGSYAPPGFLHIVLDNGTYETTGGQPTASPTTCFDQIAEASGYRSAVRASDSRELGERVAAFRVGDGPAFVTLCIADGHTAGVPRVGVTPREIRDRVCRVLNGRSREEADGIS